MKNLKKYFNIFFLITITTIGCGSPSSKETQSSPSVNLTIQNTRLSLYVPQWEEMTLTHSTRPENLIPILMSGKIRTEQNFFNNQKTSWNNSLYDFPSDWTEMIFTQVVHQSKLNGAFWNIVGQVSGSVLIELDLNLLADRQDYTVADNYEDYYGLRFPYRHFNPPQETEVANAEQPDQVKATLERDFLKNEYYKNEVVFRKDIISIKKMNIKIHFFNEIKKQEFEIKPDFLSAINHFWSIQKNYETKFVLTPHSF